jgi:hypothetical protein
VGQPTKDSGCEDPGVGIQPKFTKKEAAGLAMRAQVAIISIAV